MLQGISTFSAKKTYKELCEPSEARIFSNLCLEPNRSAKVRQSSRVSNSQCSRGSEKTQKERYEAAEGSGKKTTQVDIPKLLSQETKKGTFTKGTLPKRLGDPQTDTRSSQCSRNREKTKERVSGIHQAGVRLQPHYGLRVQKHASVTKDSTWTSFWFCQDTSMIPKVSISLKTSLKNRRFTDSAFKVE